MAGWLGRLGFINWAREMSYIGIHLSRMKDGINRKYEYLCVYG